MSTVALDVAALRARFSALRAGLAFFDGPGGTQVPDSVVDAISSYLREANANVGGSFETSLRSKSLVTAARHAAAALLGATADALACGAYTTSPHPAVSRAASADC